MYKHLAKVAEYDEDGDEISPNELELFLPCVQQQRGVTDCGLFAIAFAFHLASGNDVSTLMFDQKLMRKHLLNCFEKKKLLPFPCISQTVLRPHAIFPRQNGD